MSAQQRRVLWPAMIAMAATLTALLFVSAFMKAKAQEDTTIAPSASISPTPQSTTAPRLDFRSRLARQPEAIKLSRVLGQRLNGRRAVMSEMTGVLTVGADEQNVRLLRRQASNGEAIEMVISSRQTPLTWKADEGAKSSGETLSEEEKFIVERLTLDSPDQFVLAQLRGASYYTVGRNVRPAEIGAADGYTGPMWDIVRVAETASTERQSTEQSQGRLYYINTATGLIDKVVSSEQDGAIEAEFSNWTTVNGEKVPSRITWSRQGQVIMQFSLSTFSHSNQQ
jgi:hypothetical protein